MKNNFIFLVLLLTFSCNSENGNKGKNNYQVISLIYNKLAKPIEPVFPLPPPDSLNYVFTSKDSARIDSLINQIKKETAKRRFIVAIDSLNKPYPNVSLNNIDKNCSDYIDILSKLQQQKDTLKFDISKIENTRNDSIIYFNKELLTKGNRDFFKFDILLSFSRIAFNKDYTKAVLQVSESRSKLAGNSSLYFLEKISGKWQVKCTKELSIS
ncbi:hypothetical protein [Aureibaculum conchae]|uniref:hypothetical protein n=1 Tax=Aureibaculum sp. 2308TA14-22 TaxID=3108392 RepID=UPI003398D812